MKTKNIFSRLKVYTLLSIAFFGFFSCSSDDEDANPIVNFRVELVKITGVDTSGDGGAELEVYGNISSSFINGSQTEVGPLWTKTQQEYLAVVEQDYSINTTTILAFEISFWFKLKVVVVFIE